MTAIGFVAIECIKAGDYVLSADTDTMQTDYKRVLETYIRKVDILIHLTVNGEEIITTVDHPFYVKGQGFVNAAELCIGNVLVNSDGDELTVEKIFRESCHDEKTTVYNFQVEDYHTYFVGNCAVWVHNAGGYERAQKYANDWSDESLSKAVENIAPDSKPVKTATGKDIYSNSTTGKQVVYDTDGNYFRIVTFQSKRNTSPWGSIAFTLTINDSFMIRKFVT